MFPSQWKISLNLAIAIHIALFLGTVYLPGFLQGKPKFADIYTVSIINIAEPTPAPPAPTPPAPKPTPEPQTSVAPPPQKMAIPVETPPASPQATPAAPEQPAISLKPLKKKVVKKTPPPPDTSRQKAREQINRQRLAEAIREEELLAEKARQAREALEQERELLTPRPEPASSEVRTETPRRTATPGGGSSLLENQYNAAIANRLQQFWALPEYLQKAQEIQATVVITINHDGTIANMFFENRSGDRSYDQFVSKTVSGAAPLPPIPPALKKQRYEVGLVFRPGGIQ